MIISEFTDFLSKQESISSPMAIKSRVAKAKKAEDILCTTLDNIVSSDVKMLAALIELAKHEDPAHTPMQNAIRWYYKFVNGKAFPKIKDLIKK